MPISLCGEIVYQWPLDMDIGEITVNLNVLPCDFEEGTV